jgi:hypothetical protein
MNERGVNGPTVKLLHLIEISHRIKTLNFFEASYTLKYHTSTLFFAYLADHARDLIELELDYVTVEFVIEAMKLFPNLTSMTWKQNSAISDVGALALSLQSSMLICPKIKFLKLDTNVSSVHSSQLISAVIKACPNLSCLTCDFPWAGESLHQAFIACPKISDLEVSCQAEFELTDQMIETLILNIAEYGTQLKGLKINLDDTSMRLTLRREKVKTALMSILPRLNHLDLSVNVEGELGDISGLFEPSTDIDLRYLDIRTSNEDATMIAKILKACFNIRKLHLSGSADISRLMVNVSESCHQLVTANLLYDGQISGKLMQNLLRSCPKLAILTLRAVLDVSAYESLALYGGSLTTLRLLETARDPHTNQRDLVTLSRCFLLNSPIFDPSFKQRRQQKMKTLELYEPIFLNIKHLARFLSCFGKIVKLDLHIPYADIPAIEADELIDVPIFHAEEVELRTRKPEELEVDSQDFAYDHMFLALMNSCRSLKKLYAVNKVLKASTLLIFAYLCHLRREPLVLLACSDMLDMQDLRHSLSYIKLVQR